MVVYRCTKRLLDRLGPPSPEPPPSSTLLGDWYANVIGSPVGDLVLCASARTLLPVLFPAAYADELPGRLMTGLARVLSALALPSSAIDAEVDQMREAALATTANRRVLGSMNDFAWLAQGYLERTRDLLEVALLLAQAPCGPIAMETPRRVTEELFGANRT